MFVQTAAFYDKIYAAQGKDYAREAGAIAGAIRSRLPAALTLLDVGCGTGAHLAEFGRLGFAGRGLDADLKMVALARTRCPDLDIVPGNMLSFELDDRFDAIVSLFGTTGYARTPDHLQTAIARMATHLAPGGVLVVEPFRDFAEYRPGTVSAVYVDELDLKIARMCVSKQMGRIAILDFHYLVAAKTGVERYFERHEMGLFDDETYRDAFTAAGLSFEKPKISEAGFDRSIFIGKRTEANP